MIRTSRNLKKYFDPLKLIFCLTVMLLFNGCGSQPVKYYTSDIDISTKINSSNIVILIEGDEIQVRIVRSNLTGYLFGGVAISLIDALINNARQGLADELVKTASQSVADFSISEQLKKALEDNKQSYLWLNVMDIQRQAKEENKADTIKKLLGQRNEDVLIIVQPSFYFLPDFEGLMMKLTSTIYPRAYHLMEYRSDLKEPMSKLYEHTELHYHELGSAPKNKKSNMEIWVSNSGSEIKKAIQNGTEVLSDDLVSFLSKPFPVIDRSR